MMLSSKDQPRVALRMCDLWEVMTASLEMDGYPPSSIGRMGHGIGLELTEWPCITQWDTTLLRPGFCISLEPSVTISSRDGQGQGILVHEENLVVRKDGYELLSRRTPWVMDELVLPLWGEEEEEEDEEDVEIEMLGLSGGGRPEPVGSSAKLHGGELVDSRAPAVPVPPPRGPLDHDLPPRPLTLAPRGRLFVPNDVDDVTTKKRSDTWPTTEIVPEQTMDLATLSAETAFDPKPRVTFGFVQLPSDILLESEAPALLNQIPNVAFRVQKMQFLAAANEEDVDVGPASPSSRGNGHGAEKTKTPEITSKISPSQGDRSPHSPSTSGVVSKKNPAPGVETISSANYLRNAEAIRAAVNCFFPAVGYGAVDFVALACTSMATVVGIERTHELLRGAGSPPEVNGGPAEDHTIRKTSDIASGIRRALKDLGARRGRSGASSPHPGTEKEKLRIALVTPYLDEVHAQMKEMLTSGWDGDEVVRQRDHESSANGTSGGRLESIPGVLVSEGPCAAPEGMTSGCESQFSGADTIKGKYSDDLYAVTK